MLKLAAVLTLCAALGACSHSEPWHLKDISGLIPDLEFSVTDDSGRPVTAGDDRGKVTLLYMGYTHCPDVCPTTLATLAAALRATGRADDFRVLFVTVDPARDTQRVLHDYVRAFGPEFTGLRGTAGELEALAKRYRVGYSLGKPDAHGDYAVTHSSAVFVFDRAGHARLMMLPADSVQAITSDLERLATAAG